METTLSETHMTQSALNAKWHLELNLRERQMKPNTERALKKACLRVHTSRDFGKGSLLRTTVR